MFMPNRFLYYFVNLFETLLLVVWLVLGMIIVIKIFRRNSRKNDYIYLRRNGLSNKDLLKIEFKEALIEAILVSLVGVFVSYLKIANRSHILANMGLIVEFNIGTILSVVSISFAIIYFATWLVSRSVIKND